MWYAICGRDAAESLADRQAARPGHLERISELHKQGRLLLAGPMPAIDSRDPGPAGYHGSLIIAEFESLDEARSWAEADPYRAAGVYAELEVWPFLRVLP